MPSGSSEPGDANGSASTQCRSCARLRGGAMRLRTYLPTALVLLLLLGATAVATVAMLADANEKARLRFDDRVTAFSTLLEDAMRSYLQVLQAGAAAVNAMPSVTHGQWQKFVQDLSPEDNYPGIRGIGYVKRLRAERDQRICRGAAPRGTPGLSLSTGRRARRLHGDRLLGARRLAQPSGGRLRHVFRTPSAGSHGAGAR